MPLSRSFRESTASVRGKMGVAVIAGESIYANVRLHLAANRTYGLVRFFLKTGILTIAVNQINLSQVPATILIN